MLNVIDSDSEPEETMSNHTIPVPSEDDDDAWELNLHDGEEDEEDEGILIVPEEAAAELQQPNNNDLLYETAMSLSVPGSSLPSEIGSLHHSSVLQPTRSEDHEQQEEEMECDNNEIVLFHHNRHFRLAVRRSSLLPMALLLTLLVSFVANVFLFYQRSDLRLKELQLKQDLFTAREKLASTIDNDSRKISFWHNKPPEPIVLEQPPPPHQQEQPPMCTCDEETQNKEDNEGAATTTIVDNCWVQAKANVQLGHCAEDAKKNIQDQMGRFNKALWNLKDKIQTLVNPDEASSQGGLNSSSKNNAGVGGVGSGVSLQGLKEAATVLISGVAYASVAALLMDESVQQMFEHARDTVTRGVNHKKE